MTDSALRIRSTLSGSKLSAQLPETLRAYALARCLEAAPHLDRIPDVFGEYTDHGVDHSCTVLKLIEKLLAINSLNEWESLILVLASFYHDIGMSCPPDEWASLPDNSTFQRERRCIEELVLPSARLIDDRRETAERHIRIEFLRRHHGERCQRWIAAKFPPEHPSSLVTNVYVWELVSTVCIGHTLDARELQREDYPRACPIGTLKSVDVRFLTCLLRLADICHLSRDRALPYIRQAMRFTSRLSEKIWESVGDISGVDCDEARAVIMIAARPRSFERHRLISSFVNEIQDELQNAHRLLSGQGEDHQFSWKFVDDLNVRAHPSADYIFEPNARFQLVQDKIVGLLMGSTLYADPLYALRECLQNSIDAIRLYKISDHSAVGRIVAQYTPLANKSAVLEVFDNGVGMDRRICLQHLLSVGSQPFAFSERRYKEWGAPEHGLQLIAQHGIGFLSCFMLADRVEVFSKYRESEPVHLVLDSPTWIGEFKTTEESQFPRWSRSMLSESTPWEERHGTCVRLNLKRPISKPDLMYFLSKNVLRVGERITVIYGDECVELTEVWEVNDRWPDRAHEKETLAQLKETFFSKRKQRSSGFFDTPPTDAAFEAVTELEGDIRGMVRLHPENGTGSRLSQEGFLIRDGALSLFDGKRSESRAGSFPFFFDLDVRGQRCFGLDAERSRITDGQDILRAELINWIEESGLGLVGAIQSPLYFPCGGSYYHGGSDLLALHSSPVVVFHEMLRRWYSPERMLHVLKDGKFESFVTAKLFVVVGKAHNTAISIREMLGEKFLVLIPRVRALTPEFGLDIDVKSEGDETRFKEDVARLVVDELSGSVDFGRVIILPNFPASFSLPLSIVFRFEWLDGFRWSFLGRLIEKDTWDVPPQDMIEAKFREVGKFASKRSIRMALAAWRKTLR